MNQKVLIVLHKHAPPLADSGYVIKYFIKQWEKQGYLVQSTFGTRKRIAADIVINHVDLTVTPPAYTDYFKNYRHKINTGITDISKNVVSNCILKPGTAYTGPVIVKTNQNCGGLREENIRKASLILLKYAHKIKSAFSARFSQTAKSNDTVPFSGKTKSRDKNIETIKNWRRVKMLHNKNYPIFDSTRHLPAGIWENEHLVVEKFMPELDNNRNYICRYLYFLGNKSFCVITRSKKPIAKSHIIDRQIIAGPEPEELATFRKTFKMDYGRLDYTVVDGKINLFDANRTPAFSPEIYSIYKEQIDRLSEGINAYQFLNVPR